MVLKKIKLVQLHDFIPITGNAHNLNVKKSRQNAAVLGIAYIKLEFAYRYFKYRFFMCNNKLNTMVIKFIMERLN